jgi:hypothetical protein
MEMEVMNIPNPQRSKASARLRGHKATLDKSKAAVVCISVTINVEKSIEG